MAAIEKQLGSEGAGVMVDQAIFASLASPSDLLKKPNRDQFVVFRIMSGSSIEGQVKGGATGILAANTIPLKTRLVVDLMVRLSTDLTLVDEDFLNDETYGILAKWRAVLRAIQFFAPINQQTGNWIVIEPMRLEDFDLMPRQPVNGWGMLRSVFDLRFTLNMAAASS